MRIGTELMEERKRATLVDGTTEAATTGLMDLLSVLGMSILNSAAVGLPNRLLVKANMSKHLQPSQKLSDPTLMSRKRAPPYGSAVLLTLPFGIEIKTFLLAGDGSVA